MWRFIFSLICSLFLSQVVFSQDKELKLFAKWMTGSFDTFAQVDEDEENNRPYRHIRAILHVQPVQISGLKEAIALYVENQAAENRTKPYRQRVYIIKRNPARKIVVEVFRIANQDEVVNAYKNPSLLQKISLDKLTKEQGCDMTFERVNKNLFRGSGGTEKTCKSTLRGATHTVSFTELTPDTLTNLDQGFDDEGNHKWGPPPGTVGHIFRKRNLK